MMIIVVNYDEMREGCVVNGVSFYCHFSPYLKGEHFLRPIPSAFWRDSFCWLEMGVELLPYPLATNTMLDSLVSLLASHHLSFVLARPMITVQRA